MFVLGAWKRDPDMIYHFEEMTSAWNSVIEIINAR